MGMEIIPIILAKRIKGKELLTRKVVEPKDSRKVVSADTSCQPHHWDPEGITVT